MSEKNKNTIFGSNKISDPKKSKKKWWKNYAILAGSIGLAGGAIAVPVILVKNKKQSTLITNYWPSLDNIFKNVSGFIFTKQDVDDQVSYINLDKNLITDLGIKNFPLKSLSFINYSIKYKGIKEDGNINASIEAVNKENYEKKDLSIPITVEGINFAKFKRFIQGENYKPSTESQNTFPSKLNISDVVQDITTQAEETMRISNIKSFFNNDNVAIDEANDINGNLNINIQLKDEKHPIKLSGYKSINKIIEGILKNIDNENFNLLSDSQVEDISPDNITENIRKYLSSNIDPENKFLEEEIKNAFTSDYIFNIIKNVDKQNISFKIKFESIDKNITLDVDRLNKDFNEKIKKLSQNLISQRGSLVTKNVVVAVEEYQDFSKEVFDNFGLSFPSERNGVNMQYIHSYLNEDGELILKVKVYANYGTERIINIPIDVTGINEAYVINKIKQSTPEDFQKLNDFKFNEINSEDVLKVFTENFTNESAKNMLSLNDISDLNVSLIAGSISFNINKFGISKHIVWKNREALKEEEKILINNIQNLFNNMSQSVSRDDIIDQIKKRKIDRAMFAAWNLNVKYEDDINKIFESDLNIKYSIPQVIEDGSFGIAIQIDSIYNGTVNAEINIDVSGINFALARKIILNLSPSNFHEFLNEDPNQIVKADILKIVNKLTNYAGVRDELSKYEYSTTWNSQTSQFSIEIIHGNVTYKSISIYFKDYLAKKANFEIENEASNPSIVISKANQVFFNHVPEISDFTIQKPSGFTYTFYEATPVASDGTTLVKFWVSKPNFPWPDELNKKIATIKVFSFETKPESRIRIVNSAIQSLHDDDFDSLISSEKLSLEILSNEVYRKLMSIDTIYSLDNYQKDIINESDIIINDLVSGKLVISIENHGNTKTFTLNGFKPIDKLSDILLKANLSPNDQILIGERIFHYSYSNNNLDFENSRKYGANNNEYNGRLGSIVNRYLLDSGNNLDENNASRHVIAVIPNNQIGNEEHHILFSIQAESNFVKPSRLSNEDYLENVVLADYVKGITLVKNNSGIVFAINNSKTTTIALPNNKGNLILNLYTQEGITRMEAKIVWNSSVPTQKGSNDLVVKVAKYQKGGDIDNLIQTYIDDQNLKIINYFVNNLPKAFDMVVNDSKLDPIHTNNVPDNGLLVTESVAKKYNIDLFYKQKGVKVWIKHGLFTEDGSDQIAFYVQRNDQEKTVSHDLNVSGINQFRINKAVNDIESIEYPTRNNRRHSSAIFDHILELKTDAIHNIQNIQHMSDLNNLLQNRLNRINNEIDGYNISKGTDYWKIQSIKPSDLNLPTPISDIPTYDENGNFQYPWDGSKAVLPSDVEMVVNKFKVAPDKRSISWEVTFTIGIEKRVESGVITGFINFNDLLQRAKDKAKSVVESFWNTLNSKNFPSLWRPFDVKEVKNNETKKEFDDYLKTHLPDIQKLTKLKSVKTMEQKMITELNDIYAKYAKYAYSMKGVYDKIHRAMKLLSSKNKVALEIYKIFLNNVKNAATYANNTGDDVLDKKQFENMYKKIIPFFLYRLYDHSVQGNTFRVGYYDYQMPTILMRLYNARNTNSAAKSIFEFWDLLPENKKSIKLDQANLSTIDFYVNILDLNLGSQFKNVLQNRIYKWIINF